MLIGTYNTNKNKIQKKNNGIYFLNNNEVYNKYKKLADTENRILFGGRLAEYRYYDMHQVIGSALKLCSGLFSNKGDLNES